ncbi:MFS transporter [Paraburkholderia acidisoli]|uniref:MFS transporter n=1 Tax=Paraburkholderia acidisoli TaxID=2571748 RepID=A0A7Z2JIQ8_9BURK|nr:MFS transporter [Paraburkholderia acidisoli]QGZ65423.1 MFS transporter [Paraburkholderia acidisoli]
MNTDLALEKRTMSKVTRRLMPFLILLYFFAFLDRVNVGFAALTMNKDIGLTASLFGWGAGIFFIGYFLFEVPSNLALEKAGARIWLARIMMTWGVVSACGAFVKGPTSFMALRFILGAAEAGFFPGVILYLTFWFPSRYRAQVVGLFMLANPVSTALGSVVSGFILRMDGLFGMAGWQWLFILEGLPSVVMGCITLRYLSDSPAKAAWLDSAERNWLDTQIRAETAERARRHKMTLAQTLANPHVLVLGLIYFLIVTANNGLVLWQPQIMKALGLPEHWVGPVNAIPFVVGAVTMLVWGRLADKRGKYRVDLACACTVAAAGLALAAASTQPLAVIAGLVLAAVGGYGALPSFWALPTTFLSGTAAAAGLALANSIGNLGGFAGPYMIGYVRSTTSGYAYGLAVLAVAALLAGIIALRARGPGGDESVDAVEVSLDSRAR